MKKLLRKFNAWVDYNPPSSMTSTGWRLFKVEFREVAPIRYWIKHSIRTSVILPVKWKYEKIIAWIRHRTYDRYHIINTGLPPGYYEVDTLILNVNFNLLKDFVEVEQALHTFWWSEEYKKVGWFEKNMPFYRSIFPFRNAELGLQHFRWAATLDDPNIPPFERCVQQAVAAREILVLYKWWVEERPLRKSIDIPMYDNQGLGGLSCLDDDFDDTAADYQAYRKICKTKEEIEEKWEQEDEDMLIRLMKIRKSLWT